MEKAQQARKENDIGAAKDAASLKATNLIQEYMDKKYVQNDSLNGKTAGQYVAEQMDNNTEGNYKYIVDGTTLKVLDAATEDEIVRGTILDNGNIDWSSTGNTGNTGETENEEDNPPTLQTIASKKTAVGGTVQAVNSTANTTLVDDLGNEVIIPSGFGIASDSGTKVEEGIVIEDATNGNQFVWVPVGTFYKGTVENKTEETVTLGRYSFTEGATTNYTIAEDNDGSTVIDDFFTETEDDSVAINITDFRTKTKDAKGYYIGRYEAGIENGAYDEDDEVWKKIDSAKDMKTVCKKNATVYNYIERGSNEEGSLTGAVKESREMYDDKTGYISDLVNSYAWDTTIVFIEKCGINSNSSTYAFQTRLSENLTTTGNASDGTNKDKQCNIYDMAGNLEEWTTEYSEKMIKRKPTCTLRGVGCDPDYNLKVSDRDYDEITQMYVSIGFRPILYILEI